MGDDHENQQRKLIMELLDLNAKEAALNLKCVNVETTIRNDLLKLSGLLGQLKSKTNEKLVDDMYSLFYELFDKYRPS